MPLDGSRQSLLAQSDYTAVRAQALRDGNVGSRVSSVQNQVRRLEEFEAARHDGRVLGFGGNALVCAQAENPTWKIDRADEAPSLMTS